ncbi:MAG: hypothetical protein J7M09_05345, partial [Deltaproteobacteria bacterium]|nr:hypothetical protein [Candidatus Tharpella sp.]
MQNIGIITKRNNQRALEIGIKLCGWLKERKLLVLCEEELAVPQSLSKQTKTMISAQADLI